MASGSPQRASSPPPRDGPPDRRAMAPAESVDEAGVDPTLVRWMLALTPRERLDALQAHVDAVLALRPRLGR